MAIPLLDSLDLTGKTLTADALLTQRKLAAYLIDHQAHDVFTVKDNQPTLHEAIRVLFQDRGQPHYQKSPSLAHGRIEQRSIWTSTRLNDYLDFPGVGQVFAIERQVTWKKTGKTSTETVFGLTSHTPQTAGAARVLAYNRGHWSVENGCHYRPSTGTGTRIASLSAKVTAPRTSPPCAVSPSASSSPEPKRVSPQPFNSWHATSAGSSTICV
jgi:predicted transposase YbfD/YdcC